MMNPWVNPRELVDYIRSGPAELIFNKPLRFRQQTHSNPCDFNEFLQVLQSSETIRKIHCGSNIHLGISEDEWVLLVKAIGRVKGIRHLVFFNCSREFLTVAEAVNSAHSLRELIIIQQGHPLPRDSVGLTELANALREHTTLKEFKWFGLFSAPVPRDLPSSLDTVLRALSTCPNLRKASIMTKYASCDAIKSLLQLRPATELHLLLDAEHWLAVADEIQCGRCKVKKLTLAMDRRGCSRSDATEGAKAMVRAIRLDGNMEFLHLAMNVGFTNEEGVALAEALTVNTTLRIITLSPRFALNVPVYEALSAMLRVNTSLVLRLPPFKTDDADAKLVECRNQIAIEQRLNKVGRGRLLASRLTTREEYIDALHELSSCDVDDSPAFKVSCLYSLLQLCPAVCMS
jgi:hypothetical protein